MPIPGSPTSWIVAARPASSSARRRSKAPSSSARPTRCPETAIGGVPRTEHRAGLLERATPRPVRSCTRGGLPRGSGHPRSHPRREGGGRRRSLLARRRDPRPHRAQRRRQDDARQRPLGLPAGDDGLGPSQRTRRHRRGLPPSSRRQASCGRFKTYGCSRGSRASRTSRWRPSPRERPGAAPGPSRESCWRRCGSSTGAICSPPRCLTTRSAGSRSRGRSPRGPRSCSWTSRPRGSPTRSRTTWSPPFAWANRPWRRACS